LASISLEELEKVYDDGTVAVSDLSLEVEDGEFVVLVGPSGCGKTTALRSVAGLERVTSGVIRIGTRVVSHLEPRERDVAMVFQNYALYPHMTVRDNIAFGLRMKGVSRRERARQAREIAEILGIDDLLDRKPRALSGGQRQRVAMGRAIVRKPQAFLMDEPLSNLDAKLRVQMRSEIARIQRDVGATTIYVTHDQVEAMTMADRVVVLRKGSLQQVGPPKELYDKPANLFVASFIGSPEMNLFQARLDHIDGSLVCDIGQQTFTLDAKTSHGHPALFEYITQPIAIGVRPEHMYDAALLTPGDARFFRMRGRVAVTEALGPELLAHIEVDAEPVVTAEVREVVEDVDASLVGALEAKVSKQQSLLVGRFDADSRLRPGDVAEVAIDPNRLHFFDLESGMRLNCGGE
jgi:multiple sugar transport system ATP-binding protein